MSTTIAWTNETWNPTRGCSRISPGCENCYAERQAHRFSGPGKPYEGLTRLTSHGPRWTGVVRLAPKMLNRPLRWTHPRRIFVDSMSDLFHEALSFEDIARVFGVMACAPHHTFQVLTKRPERFAAWAQWIAEQAEHLKAGVGADVPENTDARAVACTVLAGELGIGNGVIPFEQWQLGIKAAWPLPNVWLGVSVENPDALMRVVHLCKTPAAVRFLSIEPLLERVELPPWALYGPLHHRHSGQADDPSICCCGKPKSYHAGGIDWVIIGGESGPGARPCVVEWIQCLITQCRRAGVACFVKQLGADPYVQAEEDQVITEATWWAHLRDAAGADPAEWPETLRVQEFPR